MWIELLLHTVLIKPEKVEDTDEVIKRAKLAGIEVQLDKREEKAVEYGTVVAIGPTAFKDYGRDCSILNVGDYVTHAKYCGKDIMHKGERYILCNDVDILAKLTKE
jgi:co-chaperonin GroES (HSP10)